VIATIYLDAMRRIARYASALSALALAMALAACQDMSTLAFDTQLGLGSVSLVDRCTDFMRRAYPANGIDITGSHVDAAMTRTTVTVQAARTNVPTSGIYARDIAAECVFDNGILTGFRWTAGPVRAAAAPPAP
jgi:hypothetical protein